MLALLYLGDAVDVADIAVILVVGHVEGAGGGEVDLAVLQRFTHNSTAVEASCKVLNLR